MKSQNDFEILFKILGLTKHQTIFEENYPVRIWDDIISVVNLKKSFHPYFIPHINNEFKNRFDNLYHDGVSFMKQEPSEIWRRISDTSELKNKNAQNSIKLTEKSKALVKYFKGGVFYKLTKRILDNIKS